MQNVEAVPEQIPQTAQKICTGVSGGRPPGRVYIDLTGEFPTTEGNGCKYFMVDFHIIFVWLFAIKTKDASSTQSYTAAGNTGESGSDWGAKFRNKLSKRINHVFRVNKVTTTPYKPRSNGFVENHNGTLTDQLHHYVESRQKDWNIFLPTVQLMYNTTVNVDTSYIPYYHMFGRECNLPAMGGMFTRAGVAVRDDEGMEVVWYRERTVQEEWRDALVGLTMA